MFAILALLLAVGVSDQCSVQPVYPDSLLAKSKAMLLELESMPVGIVVSHSPEQVEATQVEGRAYKYMWDYKTTVSSSNGPVRIVEFGCFSWSGEQWVFNTVTGAPFANGEFSDWYSCPDGDLVVGMQYTDENNWTGSNCLRPGKSMWYYVGVNGHGERVKGTAVVQSLAKTKQPQ